MDYHVQWQVPIIPRSANLKNKGRNDVVSGSFEDVDAGESDGQTLVLEDRANGVELQLEFSRMRRIFTVLNLQEPQGVSGSFAGISFPRAHG